MERKNDKREGLNPQKSKLDGPEETSCTSSLGIESRQTEGFVWPTENEYSNNIKGGNKVKYEREQPTTEMSEEIIETGLLDKTNRRRPDPLTRYPHIYPQITREEKEDFLVSARRFCKYDIMYIAGLLEPNEERGMTFCELREETGFDNNLLNHTLSEMVKLGYVKTMGKQRSRNYYLTKYGQILYHAMRGAMKVIEDAASRSGITSHDERI